MVSYHAFGPVALVAVLGAMSEAAESLPQVDFRLEPGKVVITVADQPAATYVFADGEILRPYFAHVRGPGGVQATRNHPPIEGQDRSDHSVNHPGIWLAFGDLGGSDFWRNHGRVVHEEFVEQPTGGPGRGTFAVRNRYVAADGTGRIVCREVGRYTLHVRPAAYLLDWDSSFSADHEFSFGDQEEMGLGIRVATAIAVEAGGTILDAQGRKNEGEVWGNAATWCDYSGMIGGRHVGLTIFSHPSNLRASWFHARDYGLLVANPFGRRAFHKGDVSKVVIKPGESLRLRYGVLVHDGPEANRLDLPTAYADFVQLTGPAE